jgi:transcriptional regulator with XRE-family HTH domain
MQRNNVLLPLTLPTQSSLRAAVSAIIRDIQRDTQETDQDTADKLGVSAGTIANARNGKADLNAASIARIGAIYGAHTVDPYHALYGARAESLSFTKTDPLASLAMSVSAICAMRHPDSEGGKTETPKEQLDALPLLKEAMRDLTAYIANIEKMKIAA